MNSDDHTPSFGVPITPRTITTEEVEAAGDAIHPELGIPIKDLNTLDAYWHERAMLACEDPRSRTPELKERAAATYQSLLELMSKSPAEIRAEREQRRARKHG